MRGPSRSTAAALANFQHPFSSFAASIGEQSALLVLAKADGAPIADAAPATLFSKLAKVGMLKSSSAYWPALLRTALRSAPFSEAYRKAWRKALGALLSSERLSFLRGVTGLLATKIDVDLVAAAERAASTEGMRFNSPEAAAKRAAARNVLSLFGLAAGSRREQAVAGAESDEEGDALDDLQALLLERATSTWPAAMCVVLALLARSGTQVKRLAAAVLEIWGNPQRVRSDTFERSLCKSRDLPRALFC